MSTKKRQQLTFLVPALLGFLAGALGYGQRHAVAQDMGAVLGALRHAFGQPVQVVGHPAAGKALVSDGTRWVSGDVIAVGGTGIQTVTPGTGISATVVGADATISVNTSTAPVGGDLSGVIGAAVVETVAGTGSSALAAQLPSAGQKAALAGSSGTPGDANRYVTDGDARNTNARTPTAHASTHAPGAGDALATAAASAQVPGDSAAEGAAASYARSDHKHSLPGYGSSAGTICQGNDARLSDARAPTAHASTHQNGGGDEVAAATSAANTIPKTGATGYLNSWVGDFTGTASGGTSGGVPAPSAADVVNNRHLRADGTWAADVAPTESGSSTLGISKGLDVAGAYASNIATASGATINWATANVQKITLANGAQSITTFNGGKAGGRYLLYVHQPASLSAGTVTWPSYVHWSGGTAPTLTTTNSQVDVVSLGFDGTTWFASATLNFAP